MADYSSANIPAPKDWQAFERKIRLLFEHSLGDSHTQNNGRIGQPQHGVDVYGRRGASSDHYVGVQCKGKDANYGGAVTKAELEAEVRAPEPQCATLHPVKGVLGYREAIRRQFPRSVAVSTQIH